MSEIKKDFTRRRFIQTTMVAAGAAAFPFGSLVAQPVPPAKYRRYNVMSPNGQKALASYARGVEAMLKLPPDHPQNWFRNAFIHLMDCPHGNWWFYVWHRGFLGYFEETIRNLSGDPDFAIPYWDWTTLPQIPDPMFDGPLNPQNAPFEPFTDNLAVFTSFIQPQLQAYWNSLNAAQYDQLNARGYTTFDKMWNDVTGNGVSGNMAFATTCSSRYLTRQNPKLDEKTAYNVSPFVVLSGLLPTDFYNTNSVLSFTSSKTPSHNTAPSQTTQFSTLEGMPHNKVHNYIGGYPPINPGPFGNMTNNLSTVDPIFFLHHSNMDRLWDIWTRKQKALHLPFLPSGQDLKTLADEPFLFYVKGDGSYVGASTAGEYFSTDRFQYDYEPGTGEEVINPPDAVLLKKKTTVSVKGELKGNIASARVPRAAVNEHLSSAAASLLAEITVERPSHTANTREYDVIVGAPADVTEVDADSPYYAGTIAFFGHLKHGMEMDGHAHMAENAKFVVPLPKRREAFANLEAAQVPVNIRVVPSHAKGKPTRLKAVTVRAVQ